MKRILPVLAVLSLTPPAFAATPPAPAATPPAPAATPAAAVPAAATPAAAAPAVVTSGTATAAAEAASPTAAAPETSEPNSAAAIPSEPKASTGTPAVDKSSVGDAKSNNEPAARPSIHLAEQAEAQSASRPTRDRGYDGPPTLLNRRIQLGGYVGVTADYSRMFSRDGSIVGLEGGLLIGHRLGIGLAGYAWTNPPPGPNDEFDNTRRFEAAYAGGAVHYSFLNNSPVYVSVGTLIGGGAVVIAPDFHGDADDDPDNEEEVDREDVDRFFVLQPEVNASVNITRWMRVSVNAGYRIASGVHKFDFDNGDISGVICGGKLQFGWL